MIRLPDQRVGGFVYGVEFSEDQGLTTYECQDSKAYGLYLEYRI